MEGKECKEQLQRARGLEALKNGKKNWVLFGIKKKLRGYLIAVFQYLKDFYKEEDVDLLTTVLKD